MPPRLLCALAALVLWVGQAVACDVVDWMEVPLPAGDPVTVALETAYPGLKVEDGKVVLSSGTKLPLGEDRDGVDPEERLRTSTIAEQFHFRYPLAFDLKSRMEPYFDPGRLRNEPLFRALYGGNEKVVRKALERAVYPGIRIKPGFLANSANCVHVQLQAALDRAAAEGNWMDRFFEDPGGSFTWRNIAGTRRLSVHSFGIAIDINTSLGTYWRWSGAKPGEVEEYRTEIPAELVADFERYGFIWGGKWHHYDGMHFEYRPELILYSRLTGG